MEKNPSESSPKTIPKERGVSTKRGRYVSRACLDCKKRKVRCSGVQPCEKCQDADVECLFQSGRFRKPRSTEQQQQRELEQTTPRRRKKVGQLEQLDLQAQQDIEAGSIEHDPLRHQTPNDRIESDSLGSPSQHGTTRHKAFSAAANSVPRVPESETWKLEIVTRLADLEQRWGNWDQSTINGNYRATSTSSHLGSRANTESVSSGEQNQCILEEDDGYESNDSHHAFQGGTSLRQSINALDRTVRSNSDADQGSPSIVTSESAGSQRCYYKDCTVAADCCIEDLGLWHPSTKSLTISNLNAAFQVFFDYPHPHFPCLNEPQFRAQFQAIVNNESLLSRKDVDSLLFIALVNFMVAVVKILSEYCSDSVSRPGLREFGRAEHLLSHTTTLGRGNILAVQCLLLKSLYLLYAEKHNLAYDSMGTAVRLCFQIGLHNQASWRNCGAFEKIMRQRIFWSVYCLDRNIALVSGAPYLLRESDFRVDLPQAFNDRQLFPNKSLPQETPSHSPAPYLTIMARWGKLSSDIWDAMFGINSQKPICPEFVATMDARIVLLVNQMPSQLQWKLSNLEYHELRQTAPFVIRQSLILHLRTNNLRLLIRQEEMVSLKYDRVTAETCVGIASSSIDSISKWHNSWLHQQTERYTSVTYLAGAILPLICVIVKETAGDSLKATAIEHFNKALAVLHDISLGLALGRRTLKRLQRITPAAEHAMTSLWPRQEKSALGSLPHRMDQGYDLPSLNPLDSFSMMGDETGLTKSFDDSLTFLLGNGVDNDQYSFGDEISWLTEAQNV